MKRILIISNYYYPHIGGIEQTARDCVNAMKADCEVKVLCFNEYAPDAAEEIDGVEVVKCGAPIKISSQAIAKTYEAKLKAMFLNFQPGIVMFHYPNPFAAHYLLKSLPDSVRLILYWHSDIVKQKLLRLLFLRQNERLLARADTIVATSPNYIEGSACLSRYRDKCVVVPSCVNTARLEMSEEEIREAERMREQYAGNILCAAVGRHVEYKGFAYLIKACAYLSENIHVLMIGDGPLGAKLRRMAEPYGNVRFLGRLPDSELKKYLYMSDIYCFPSVTKNEAFGLSLAEAMYFGKPAVTFHIPGSGVNYVSLDGVSGIETPNGDAEGFAKAIQKLADDSALRSAMGSAARKRVEELFSFNVFAENVRNVVGLA